MPFLTFGQSYTRLSGERDEYFLSNKNFEILEDKNNSFTVEDVSGKLSSSFVKNGSDFLTNKNPKSSYWIRFTLENDTDGPDNWLIEEFNYKINDLTLYMPDSKGVYSSISLGDDRSFVNRIYQHKNHVFPINVASKKAATFYLKYSSESQTQVQLVVRDRIFFSSYIIKEYYLLGFFYGIIFIFAIYNLAHYFTFRDKAYLYYVAYVICFGVFFMVLDGTSFQFLWPNLPILNVHGYALFLLLTIVAFIFYVKSFLNLRKRMPMINSMMNWYIVVRVLLFVATIYIPSIREITYLEFIPFALSYYASIIIYKGGYDPAKYFIISFSIVFAVLVIHVLRIMGWIPSTVITFYSIYLTPIVEIIILNFAMSSRVREIKEKKILSKKLRAQLEEKVAERTSMLALQNEIIKEKMTNLDSFIYKVSHDLRSPVRSILGLARSGKIDKSMDPEIYFDYIVKSTEKLDAVITDLLAVSRTVGKNLQFSEIKINTLFDDILANLEGNPDRKSVDITISIKQQHVFYSERTLLYSIVQNLVENAIHYRNRTEGVNCYLNIELKEFEDQVQLTFKDNGIGIGEEHIEKIFDMFYRADEKHHNRSTGLGLYMVKMALERISGTVEVESKVGSGSIFTIRLKNFVQQALQEGSGSKNVPLLN